MIDAHGRVKVTDFGLAKLKQDQDITKTGSTVGTLAYMSPEQIQGKPVGLRSDLFSLGVVLFEMLAGTRPFRGEHEAAMTYAIVNEEPASIGDYMPEAPEKLEQFFGKALAKEPADRYESAARLLDQLPGQQASEGTATSAGSAGAVFTRIPRKLTAGTITGIVLAAVLLAGWWIMTSQSGYKDVGSQINDRSIAVLPFDNLSGTEEAQPFVNGIHDDLLTRLSKIADFKVISRTSVLPYRQTELSLPDIADSLNVRWIVEGGVQKVGD